MMRDELPPTKAYLASLGRDPNAGNPPPHPREWRYCHAPPTEMQMVWLSELAFFVGASHLKSEMAGLTRGQASLLIAILREKSRISKGFDRGKAFDFEQAVRDVRDELPVPEGDEARQRARREGFVFVDEE
ncbi:hypothetical protein BV20DRAFT_974494 [Pilatotrama ljubarskyi]|nr:hypothetical protein BV20DRAFT_974494 [Pilatotrama ljubarskyi]